MGRAGLGPGQFFYPAGIAIAANGHVFVAENNNHRVQEFTRDGAFIASFGSFGSAPGQLNTPNFMAADSWGNAFVADQNNSRIQVFAPGGALKSSWGRTRFCGRPVPLPERCRGPRRRQRLRRRHGQSPHPQIRARRVARAADHARPHQGALPVAERREVRRPALGAEQSPADQLDVADSELLPDSERRQAYPDRRLHYRPQPILR